MATQFGKDKLKFGESSNTENIIEIVFKEEPLEVREDNEYQFVVPETPGNANVISKNEFILDPYNQLIEESLLNRNNSISTLKVQV